MESLILSRFKRWSYLALSILFVGSTGIVGCSGSSSGSISENPASEIFGPQLLTMTPFSTKVNLGDSAQLTASGGSPPYSFDIYVGSGSLQTSESTVVYHAPNAVDTTVLRVQDTQGNIGYASIEVINAPLIQPSTKTVAVGNKFPFAAIGGKLPYSFSVVSGDGAIELYIYRFTDSFWGYYQRCLWQ